MSRLETWIALLHRRPHEMTSLTSPGALRRRWILFVSLTLLLTVPLAVTFFRNITEWSRFAADVPLPTSQWLAYYDATPEPCGIDARPSSRCVANPANPSLWNSPMNLVDHPLHKARVLERNGREYWIGTTISPAQLRDAYARQANFLVLGQIRGSYRFWANGMQMMSGKWLDNEPVAVQFPLEWLARPGPLRIAIRCVKDVDVNDSADMLEIPPRLGLATKAGTTSWRRYQSFWFNSRPILFLALNLLLACLFFGIWQVAPEKTEYFYIAVMALAYAFFQMRYVDLFSITTDRRLVNGLGLVASILYAFSGMLAGFAFARLRPLLLRICQGVCLACCAIIPLLIRDTIQQQIHSSYWFGRIADLCTVLGAGACLLQAAHLYRSQAERFRLNLRIRRLLMFGVGLLLLTGFNQILFTSGDVSFAKMLLGKSGPFFLLLSLGLVALSEYRTQNALAQAMPISRFHRLDPLPLSVRGAIMKVDLKGSERISRMSARLGRAGDLLESCLSHLWMAVSQHGGLVLQTEGDALLAIFPAGDLPEDAGAPLAAAFAAADAMRRNLAELEQRFVSQGLAAIVPPGGIHFRAAIAEGEIRPIWQAYGGTRLANWTETGHLNVLVETARLLELERQIEADGDAASVVITLPEAKNRLPAARLAGHWLFERRSLAGKHGREYEVAAYRVDELRRAA